MFKFRLQIAGMHYNENSDREQATDKEGKLRFDVLFPKYKKGQHIVRKVMTEPTFSKFGPPVTVILTS